MKRIFIYTFFTLLCPLCAYGQTTEPNQDHINQLVKEQAVLKQSQDSLQQLLSTSRAAIATASEDERTEISQQIVSLEGQLFDIRAKIGGVGNELAAIEEQFALESLLNAENMTNGGAKDIKIYQSENIGVQLSKFDISTFESAHKVEATTIEALARVDSIYGHLYKTKELYDNSRDQLEIDSLLVIARGFSDKIAEIDATEGAAWLEYYNLILGKYLVMFNSAPNLDRDMMEAIDGKSREVRRSESLMQQGSLAPNLVVFDVQRSLLMSYEDAIAKSLNLTGDYSIFADTKVINDTAKYVDLALAPKILTLYSDVSANYDYGYTEVSDIPEVIFPPKGVYYSIQVAVIAYPAKNLPYFRGAGPVQVNTISEKKYQYMLGGYRTYDEAQQGVAKLKQIGFRMPTIVAFVEGESVSISEAKAIEAKSQSAGQFKVVLTTTNSASGEVLRSVMDMHAKGKSVVRIVDGEDFVFTVTEFDSKEEAEVFAQIFRDRSGEENIKVIKID